MNILKIKIGDYSDDDYSEFIFKTNLPKKDFYDENFNLTEMFRRWLVKNNPWILAQVNLGRLTDIFWYAEESLDEIIEL